MNLRADAQGYAVVCTSGGYSGPGILPGQDRRQFPASGAARFRRSACAAAWPIAS